MIFFKLCRKCGGDMHLDKDGYGAFVTCIQCGFVRDISTDKVAAAAVAAERPAIVARAG